MPFSYYSYRRAKGYANESFFFFEMVKTESLKSNQSPFLSSHTYRTATESVAALCRRDLRMRGVAAKSCECDWILLAPFKTIQPVSTCRIALHDQITPVAARPLSSNRRRETTRARSTKTQRVTHRDVPPVGYLQG